MLCKCTNINVFIYLCFAIYCKTMYTCYNMKLCELYFLMLDVYMGG